MGEPERLPTLRAFLDVREKAVLTEVAKLYTAIKPLQAELAEVRRALKGLATKGKVKVKRDEAKIKAFDARKGKADG